MARLARSVFAGYPHHLVQRGHGDRIVFEVEADYLRYLEWLREYIARYRIDIWAYCLMPSHVHVICVPKVEGTMARAFNTLHMRYAQYFNGKRAERGRLWRARFMSCALDNQSVREDVRFIENNPVRLGMVERAEDYRWSSAQARLRGGIDFDPVLCRSFFMTDEINDWPAFLASRGDEAVLLRTRTRLKTGRPAGDAEFVRELEAIAGRRLGALPRGRPRKVAATPSYVRPKQER
jgi:putative transposase